MALLVCLAIPTPMRASGAQSLADKQAEAARIERELESRGQELSMVAERYNVARLASERAGAEVADARRQLADAERALAGARSSFQEHVVALYKGTNAPDPMGFLSVRSIAELSTRTKYASIVTTRSSALLDDFRELRRREESEAAQVQASRDEAEAAAQRVATERHKVEAAMSAQRALLQRLEGEIGRLVAQEQQRREAEEERRARERAARERPTRPSSPSSPSSPSAPSGPPPAPHPRAAVAVATAKAQLGKPYLWAADGPDAFDCSGLTMFAWAAAGVSLPHSSGAQFSSLPHVSMDDLAPGDLLFYGSPIHHVGLFVGGGQMVNAPQTGEQVRVSSIHRADFTGAARPR